MLKKFLVSAIAIFSSVSFGATTNPVQLLNPTGSASGQAVVSTGPTTAPKWGGVGVNGIASIAANTVIANATGSAASPTAFAMPSCAGSGAAINWQSGAGFQCNTSIGAATLLGATWASPLAIGSGTPAGGAFTTLSASGLITPSTTNGIKGTAAADNAIAGSVGEFQTAQTSSTSLTTTVAANCTSISLTAGDWDVRGVIQFTPAASTNLLAQYVGISTTSATMGVFGTQSSTVSTVPAGSGPTLTPSPTVRINVSTTTTVFLVGQASFNTSTLTCNGIITARRIR